VRNGRLVLDEPTELPDGSVVELIPLGDDLDDEDRARLHAALDGGIADAERGDTVSVEEVLAELRTRR
jgi:hypothetical protein